MRKFLMALVAGVALLASAGVSEAGGFRVRGLGALRAQRRAAELEFQAAVLRARANRIRVRSSAFVVRSRNQFFIDQYGNVRVQPFGFCH